MSDSVPRAHELIKNEDLIRIADAFPSTIWITQPDGYCIYLSQRWYDITGQQRDKALGYGWLEAVHPDDRKHAEEEFLKANKEHSRFHLTYRLRHYDGEYRWVTDLGSPRFSPSGSFEGFVGSINDIHEEVLSKEQLRIALEGSEMGYFDFYPPSGKLIWSERTRALYGFPMDGEPTVDYYAKILHPEDRERVMHKVGELLKHQSDERYLNEYRIIHPATGKIHWIRSTGKCYFDSEGNPERFSGIVQDVTREKESLQSLQLQSTVLEQMDEGVSISDDKGYILFTNDAEDRMFGYEKGELIGKHVSVQNNYTEEENNRRVAEAIAHLKKTGTYKGEWNNIKKDGTPFYTFAYISNIVIDGKNYFVCVQRDITVEKKIKEGLEASEKRFKHIFEGAPVSIWEEDFSFMRTRVEQLMSEGVTDIEAFYEDRPEELQELIRSVIVKDINLASLQLMEAGSKDELKAGLQNIFVEDTTEAFRKELNVIASGGGRFEYESRLKTLKGKVFDALIHINFPPINDSYKSVMVTLTDISMRKQIQELLEKTVQERTIELQRSNQDLQQFGHVISHDLKEPVRKILTFANRLNFDLNKEADESKKLYIDKILASANRMTHMIDGVLTYSMIDSSERRQNEIDLNEVIAEIQKDLDLLVHENDVTFEVSKLPVVPGIRIHLYQVLYNLVNNSIKFRKPGVPPVIQIHSVPAEEKGMVSIVVADNGIGFDPQYSSVIFKAFQRLHSKSKYEGTGLGLALCQKIVERHGGKIEATGALGEGAKFIVKLPR
jgi:PAS domain S-box-containing protein